MKTLIATLALFAILFVEAWRQRREWQAREAFFAATGTYDIEEFLRRATVAIDHLSQALRDWNPTMEEAAAAFVTMAKALREAETSR